MLNLNVKFWLKFSLINLLIVAALGALMRYKIGFVFPYFNQKNIQNSHSHFAFAGWIAQTLYILMVNFIENKVQSSYSKQYKALVFLNLLCAYGMLISFFTMGYGVLSIVLSTFTIVIACFFAVYFFRDLKKVDKNNPSKAWFKAALWFNILSSLGTFYLAYILSSKDFNFNLYLASLYYYLHFQYNGFFIFACMGLAVNEIPRLMPQYKYNKIIFTLSFYSVIPAYLLSILWANLPLWLYIIVIIAAFIQVIASYIFINGVRKAMPGSALPRSIKYMVLFVFVAYIIKIFLQLGSTIPEMNTLAFGFRPVVIAYLHLVLLGVVSVFLITYAYSLKFIENSKITLNAITIFLIGILLNEVVLAVQGIAAFSYTTINYVNEILFAVALVLFLGALLLVISQYKKHREITT